MYELNNVAAMKNTFDSLKHVDENGKEYWDARELSKVLGYSRYRNFEPVIERARAQMENTGHNPDLHIQQSSTSVNIGSGVSKEIESMMLDKYAAYNVALNADPHKEEGAFAQQYFINNTATVEHLHKRMEDKNYIVERDSLRIANSEFAKELVRNNLPENKLGYVMSGGDNGFFTKPTKQIKEEIGIPQNKPLADMLGSDLIAFKKVAQIMSREEVKKNGIRDAEDAYNIAFDKNRIMRNLVIDTFNTPPENMIPGEDVKKVEKRYNKETSALLKQIIDEEC